MSLTDAGYTAPRGADFLELMIGEIEAALNITLPRTSDNATYQLLVAMSLRLAELSEATQALYDMRDSNNATGAHLRNNGALVGVYPLPATRSEVVLTLGGVASTVVPAGATVRDTQGQTWELTQAVTIPGTGNALAVEFGAIRGFEGSITEIVSAVTGWETVTNDSPAQLGRNAETDEEFRQRRARDLRIIGGGSPAAIRARLIQELDFIDKVTVIDNDTQNPIIVSSYTLPPGAALISVFPEPVLIANIDALAVKIWELITSGTELVGGAARNIISADNQPKLVRWHNATPEFVQVDVELTLAPGFGIDEFTADVQQIVKDYISALEIGDVARRLQLAGQIATLRGIIGVTIKFDTLNADYTPSPIDFIFPDPINVVEA